MRQRDGSIAWSCASTTYAGWDDVRLVGKTVYALAGNDGVRDGPPPVHVHAIYALRSQDGSQLWSYSFRTELTSGLAIDNGMMVVGDETFDSGAQRLPGGHSELVALRASDGGVAWIHTFDGLIHEPLTVAHRILVAYQTGSGQQLLALRESDGAELWSIALSVGVTQPTLGVVGHTIYGYFPDANLLMAIDGAHGVTRWTQKLTGAVSGPVDIEPNAILSVADMSVAAYDPATGAQRWSVALDDTPRGEWEIGKTVYVLTATAQNTPSHLLALNATTGSQRWQRDMSAYVSLGLQRGVGDQAYLTVPTGPHLLETVVALTASGAARWSYNGQSLYNAGVLIPQGATLYYIWQAPAAGVSVNAPDITYVTSLRAADGSKAWESTMPLYNEDLNVAPLVGA